jgi:hypothetical protein
MNALQCIYAAQNLAASAGAADQGLQQQFAPADEPVALAGSQAQVGIRQQLDVAYRQRHSPQVDIPAARI